MSPPAPRWLCVGPADPDSSPASRRAIPVPSVYAHMDVVRLLLARGASLRRDERYGIYAASLHWRDAPELLALLVEHAGPDADLDADFGPALVRAAANRAGGEVRYLLSIGVDPDWPSRRAGYSRQVGSTASLSSVEPGPTQQAGSGGRMTWCISRATATR